MYIKVVQSLDKYISEIKKINKKSVNKNIKLWFRGHSMNESFKLMPSLYRDPYLSNSANNEIIFLNTFKARAIPYLDKSPKAEPEWMFLMQHYRMPTRLLDWSEDAFVALLFALKDHDESKGENAVVWILNPYELNKEYIWSNNLLENVIPNITDDREPFKQIYKMYSDRTEAGSGKLLKYPIAILPQQSNKRIIAQKGVFTLFPPVEIKSLEDTEKAENFLCKIEIENSKVIEIKKDLNSLGISEVSLFPELDYIAKNILQEYISR